MAKTESKGKAAGSALLPAVSPEKIVKGMSVISRQVPVCSLMQTTIRR